MKNFFYSLLLISPLCSAQYCKTPWEDVPPPVPSVKTCRLSVPHGWLVFNFAVEDIEIPATLFYPDENHEWFIQN
jgi:hypothetical protein